MYDADLNYIMLHVCEDTCALMIFSHECFVFNDGVRHKMCEGGTMLDVTTVATDTKKYM